MSDDYTPTTGDIRNHYAYGCGPDHTWEESRAQFDRWLAGHDKAASARVTELEAERDAAVKSRDGWASRMMEFASAQLERDKLAAELAECHKAAQPGSDVTRAEERERCAVIAERFVQNSRYRIRHQNLQPLEAVRRTMTEDIAAAIRAKR